MIPMTLPLEATLFILYLLMIELNRGFTRFDLKDVNIEQDYKLEIFYFIEA
mgnify:CR=1 FL=1